MLHSIVSPKQGFQRDNFVAACSEPMIVRRDKFQNFLADDLNPDLATQRQH
jgi:hypothetical protein